MKILLHVGVEKTGSSHLQSICAINKEALRQNGIWYPMAKRETDLSRKGRISAGNAKQLKDSIKANDELKITLFFKERIKEAKAHHCHSVLLSNELLLFELSKEDKLKKLYSITQQLKVEIVDVLLVLRDPIEQALSLYKHRTKDGRVPDLEEWFAQHYFYGDAILAFLKNIKDLDVQLKVGGYKKKKGWLEDLFFKDWLNLDINLKSPPKVVNPSLSLSELMLLKKTRQYNPELVSILYKSLIRIDKKEKTENKALLEYHHQVLSQCLQKYKETWSLCNTYLKPDESMQIVAYQNKKITDTDINASFSDTQIDVIAKFMTESLSLKFIIDFSKLKIKNHIFRGLRKLKLG